jgi:fructokinase
MDGAAAGASVVFGVILGTGVGAGIVVNGHILTGPNAIAGEWGHNPLPWPQAHELPSSPCYCGKQGCIEAFLSGPGMMQLHQRETGVSLSPEEIVKRAEQGDATCERSLQTYENHLARGLAHVNQHPRPGRHRAGRWHVQHRAAVHERARAVGRVGVFRSGGYKTGEASLW